MEPIAEMAKSPTPPSYLPGTRIAYRAFTGRLVEAVVRHHNRGNTMTVEARFFIDRETGKREPGYIGGRMRITTDEIELVYSQRVALNTLQDHLVRTASPKFLNEWYAWGDSIEAEMRLARSVVEDAAQLRRDPVYAYLLFGPDAEVSLSDHADELLEISLEPGNGIDGSEERAMHRLACIVMPAVEAYWRIIAQGGAA